MKLFNMKLHFAPTWHLVAATIGLAAVAWISSLQLVQGQSETAPRYTNDGKLLAPVGFETWVFVGSNLGMAYRQGLPAMTSSEASRADKQLFHNVYINPEAYASFISTGRFPEPTILVMEIFAAADKEPKGVLAQGVFNGERLGAKQSDEAESKSF